MDERQSSLNRRRPNKYKIRPSRLKGKYIGLFHRDIARAKNAEEAAQIAKLYEEKSQQIHNYNPLFNKKVQRKELKSANLLKNRPIGEIVIPERTKEHIEEILCNSSDHVHFIDDCSYSAIEDSYFKRTFLSNIRGSMNEKIQGSTNMLISIPEIDEKLHREQMDKMKNIKFTAMLRKRKTLPAFNKRKEILDMTEGNQVVLITGETGCGKTTQVAQFILDDYIERKKGTVCKIICTQPRRISAISVAERVAEERNERLGVSVGYHIRLEKKLPRDYSSICFCTTGVVLRQMESNPALTDVSHLIIDEIHERSVTSDFLMAVLQEVIQKRKNIRVILMSATLNYETFSKYYGNCLHLNIPGFTYPVKQYFLEDVLERINFKFSPSYPEDTRRWKWKKKKVQSKTIEFEEKVMPFVDELLLLKQYSVGVCRQLLDPTSECLNLHLIFDLVKHLCVEQKDDNGSILIFLPGYQNISELHKLFRFSKSFPDHKFLLIPLHSQLSTVDQKKIFVPAPPGKRKIIISTNIAETSITIDDVTFVIDSGKIKMSDFDAETNTATLKEQWVSRANADQRKGRAGRVKPGVCFHLYTRGRYMVLEQYPKPEILRVRLDQTILQAKILQLGNISDFFSRLMDPPDLQKVSISLTQLKLMNALDDKENLTPLGYHLARLPMAPQMGKMILFGAIFSCLDPILSIATTLDYKDPFQIPLGKEREADKLRVDLAEGTMSDHILYHLALTRYAQENHPGKFCYDYFLSAQTLKLLQEMKLQFMKHLFELNFVKDLNPKNSENNQNSSNMSLVKAVICAGLYPNIAVIKNNKRGRCVCLKSIDFGKRLCFHPKSVLYEVKYFDRPLVTYYTAVKSAMECLHDATLIHSLPVVFFGDHFTRTLDGSKEVITIGNCLKFIASEDTSRLINDLRNRMNWFIEYKISHPGPVSWTEQSNEIDILRAIMKLITIEDNGNIYNDDEEEDEDLSELGDDFVVVDDINFV